MFGENRELAEYGGTEPYGDAVRRGRSAMYCQQENQADQWDGQKQVCIK